MAISLDTKILVDTLRSYRKEHGRGAIAELHNISGVHNLGRFSTGKMTPTLETWMQLYLSAPDIIPPPTTLGGGVFALIGESCPDAQQYENVHASRPAPIAGEERFWELYSRHRSAAVVKTLTAVLEKIERALAKAV